MGAIVHVTGQVTSRSALNTNSLLFNFRKTSNNTQESRSEFSIFDHNFNAIKVSTINNERFFKILLIKYENGA